MSASDTDEVELVLDRSLAEYEPGATLTATLTAPATDMRTIELSVVWFTEGKGDEDLAVHFFREWTTPEALNEWRQPVVLSVPLPLEPHSYDGVLLRIHWEVRLRVQPEIGTERRRTQRFRVGQVAPIPPKP